MHQNYDTQKIKEEGNFQNLQLQTGGCGDDQISADDGT